MSFSVLFEPLVTRAPTRRYYRARRHAPAAPPPKSQFTVWVSPSAAEWPIETDTYTNPENVDEPVSSSTSIMSTVIFDDTCLQAQPTNPEPAEFAEPAGPAEPAEPAELAEPAEPNLNSPTVDRSAPIFNPMVHVLPIDELDFPRKTNSSYLSISRLVSYHDHFCYVLVHYAMLVPICNALLSLIHYHHNSIPHVQLIAPTDRPPPMPPDPTDRPPPSMSPLFALCALAVSQYTQTEVYNYCASTSMFN